MGKRCQKTNVETLDGVLQRITKEMLQEKIGIEIETGDEHRAIRWTAGIIQQGRELVEHDRKWLQSELTVSDLMPCRTRRVTRRSLWSTSNKVSDTSRVELDVSVRRIVIQLEQSLDSTVRFSFTVKYSLEQAKIFQFQRAVFDGWKQAEVHSNEYVYFYFIKTSESIYFQYSVMIHAVTYLPYDGLRYK